MSSMQIRHIAVRANNPEELSSFYQKVFGLKVVRKNPRGAKSSIYMSDGYMHLALNAPVEGKPNGIWHFGLLVPSLESIKALTPVYEGESAPGRHTENFIYDPEANRIDVVADMWPL